MIPAAAVAHWPAPTPIRRRTRDCAVRELPDGSILVGVGHGWFRVPPGVLARIFAGGAL